MPKDWPKDPITGKPLQNAYHSSRVDLDDWVYIRHIVHLYDRITHQVQFLIEVLKAVVFGSSSRSPFFTSVVHLRGLTAML